VIALPALVANDQSAKYEPSRRMPVDASSWSIRSATIEGGSAR
jgi:hypothetical protein